METQKEINIEPHVTEWFIQIDQAIKELSTKRQGALELMFHQNKLDGEWQSTPDFTKLIKIEPKPIEEVK